MIKKNDILDSIVIESKAFSQIEFLKAIALTDVLYIYRRKVKFSSQSVFYSVSPNALLPQQNQPALTSSAKNLSGRPRVPLVILSTTLILMICLIMSSSSSSPMYAQLSQLLNNSAENFSLLAKMPSPGMLLLFYFFLLYVILE